MKKIFKIWFKLSHVTAWTLQIPKECPTYRTHRQTHTDELDDEDFDDYSNRSPAIDRRRKRIRRDP
jgi:hypothetical protein